MEATGIRLIQYRDRDAEFSIYDIADIHWGTRGCAKEHLTRDIRRIERDPHALWLIGGDYCDWITPGDPRFDPECVDGDMRINDLSQIAALLATSLARQFIPIKDKCIGICMGNHELKHFVRHSEMFIHAEICRALDAPNMRYSGWADLYFRHNPRMKAESSMTMPEDIPEGCEARLRIFVHHGTGAAATAGGKINALKKLVDITHGADLVMMGHVHEQFTKAFVRLAPDALCRERREHVTMGVVTGSYLRIYGPDHTSYGEVRGYNPTTLGATRARFSPREKTLIVENKADGIGII